MFGKGHKVSLTWPLRAEGSSGDVVTSTFSPFSALCDITKGSLMPVLAHTHTQKVKHTREVKKITFFHKLKKTRGIGKTMPVYSTYGARRTFPSHAPKKCSIIA